MIMRKTIVVASFLFGCVFLTAECEAQKTAVNVTAVAQNTSNGQISEIGRLSETRASHSATLLEDGTVLIVGGMARNGVFFANADIFDPETNLIRPVKNSMTRKRVGQTATRLLDGRVLIAGGWSNRDAPERSAEIFDPKKGEFIDTVNMAFRRSGHTSTLLADGKVLIAGGTDNKTFIREAELFDPATNTFISAGKMHIARSVHTATVLNDGKILFAGGDSQDGQVTNTAEIYDPMSKQFTIQTGAMTTGRYKHDAVKVADGRVLIFGGSNERDWNGQFNSAEIFDPKSGKFTRTGDMNFRRFKIAGTAVPLKDGRVFIGGGASSAEVFDPKTERFTVVMSEFGTDLHYASATLLKDGRALVVGGYGNGNPETGPISTDRVFIFSL